MTRTVYIARDERWPDYELKEEGHHDVAAELPAGEAVRLLARFRSAARQWDQVQKDLHELYEAAHEDCP